jgi:hypothetical protein
MQTYQSDGDRIVIGLPSGNSLALHCLGGRTADLVGLHSIDSGDGASPAHLDLVVSDPDTVDDDFGTANAVFRLRVRHHGPTDGVCVTIPADLLDTGVCPTGDGKGVLEGSSEGNRLEIRLPSRNLLIFDYLGGRSADCIVLHSIYSGDSAAPTHLDLIVPNPDAADGAGDDGRPAVNACHVHVRHHGPADIGLAALPPGFTADCCPSTEDDLDNGGLPDEDDCLET